MVKVVIKDLESQKVVLQHYNIVFSDKKSDHNLPRLFELVTVEGKITSLSLNGCHIFLLSWSVYARACKSEHMNANAVMFCVPDLMVPSFALAVFKKI